MRPKWRPRLGRLLLVEVMGRLKAIRPRLQTVTPRLAQAGNRDRRRDAEQPWRQWYKTAAWQRLRASVIVRDMSICQQTGVLLVGRHPAPDSPVVDHIVPHRGDPELFWDERNLQTVSKAYHDSEKQSLEARGRVSYRPAWVKPSAVPVTLVCGPPASGKTTWVEACATAQDVVIDLDHIVAGLSGQPMTHMWDRQKWWSAAIRKRNSMLGALSQRSEGSAWVIMTAPTPKEREFWRRQLVDVRVVVLAKPVHVCAANAARDGDRDLSQTMVAVRDWWNRYAPSPQDQVVRDQ